MPPTHPPGFEHTIHPATVWLKAVSEDMPRIVPAVAAAVRDRVSPGRLERALEQRPHDIRAVLLQPAA